jgi:hypothetical protein
VIQAASGQQAIVKSTAGFGGTSTTLAIGTDYSGYSGGGYSSGGGSGSIKEIDALELYKAGKISLAAALRILNKQTETEGEGLAGFGVYGKAFKQIIKGGTSFDAVAGLKNLAIEGKEKGIDLGEIRAGLVDKGYNPQQIEKFFTRLHKMGIGTIEDLSNASDLDLMRILKSMAGKNNKIKIKLEVDSDAKTKRVLDSVDTTGRGKGRRRGK